MKVFFFIVYRQGDIGTSWYAVLSGSLDVKVSETSNYQVRQIDGEKAHNEVLLNCSEIKCVRQKLVCDRISLHLTVQCVQGSYFLTTGF